MYSFVGNIHICIFSFFVKTKALGITQELLLPAIVHDYFLNRGVPGSADMIPSASEPVLFPTSIIHNLRKKLQVNCVKIDFSLVAGYLLGSDFFL